MITQFENNAIGLAVTFVVPETVAPLAGDVIVTVGATLGVAAFATTGKSGAMTKAPIIAKDIDLNEIFCITMLEIKITMR